MMGSILLRRERAGKGVKEYVEEQERSQGVKECKNLSVGEQVRSQGTRRHWTECRAIATRRRGNIIKSTIKCRIVSDHLDQEAPAALQDILEAVHCCHTW